MPYPRVNRAWRKYYRKRARFHRGGVRRLGGGSLSRLSKFGMKNKLGVHHFKRTFIASDTLPISSSGNYLKGLYFTFNSLPNYTEFTTLYDYYRINKIVVKAVPNFSGSELGPQGASVALQALPNLHSAVDYDSGTDPANINELLQYSTYKMTRGNQVHTRIWTPACAGNLLGTGGTETSQVLFKKWVNLSYTDTEFFGIKFGLEQSNFSQGKYILYVSMYFSCKGVR